MSNSEEEVQASSVNRTVQQLREVFEPMAQRLTADVEPATIYFPAVLAASATSGEDEEV